MLMYEEEGIEESDIEEDVSKSKQSKQSEVEE